MRKIQYLQIPEQDFVEEKVSIQHFGHGMISNLDALDIPLEAVSYCRDVRIINGRITGRTCVKILTPTKPNSNAVLNVYTLKKNSGTLFTLRFTKSTIHKRVAGPAWTNITGPALNGTETDRYTIVTAFNECVFSNNGVNVIMKFDSTIATYAALGNAPKYKYITAFYNRIIGASFVDATPNPTQVGWSADGVITEWNPATNITAGSTPLVESPGDFSDEITGIFGLANIMVIFRQKSLWIANKQPSGINPFYFYPAVPGIGCDLPYSIQVTPNGLIWADTRTRQIWIWDTKNLPVPIGDKISEEVFKVIQDPTQVFSDYNASLYEYSLGIRQDVSDLTRFYVFNVKDNNWVLDERYYAIAVNTIIGLSEEVTIGSLIGNIGDLVGNIGDLSGSKENRQTRVFSYFGGIEDGEIAVEDPSMGFDLVAGSYNGQCQFRTKAIELPDDLIEVKEIRLSVKQAVPGSGGDIVISLRSIEGDKSYGSRSLDLLPAHNNKRRTLVWKIHRRIQRFVVRCIWTQFTSGSVFNPGPPSEMTVYGMTIVYTRAGKTTKSIEPVNI